MKWAGAAVTAVLCAAWITSAWCENSWRYNSGTELRFGRGRVTYATPTRPDGTYPYRFAGSGLPPHVFWGFSWGPTGSNYWFCAIPLWLPVAASALVTLAAWRIDTLARRERARQLGLCLACNYDRTGLAADAVCPECGSSPK